jgi:transcriptional regulator GlxA family with amidase domain
MPSKQRVVVVVVYDGVQLLDVAGPVEVFDLATARGANYRVVLASPDGADITTTSRTRLGVDAAFDALPATIDTLLVPGAPTAPDVAADDPVVRAVADAAPHSRRVASVCAGTFLLASAGLLDGRRAATHWEFAARLAVEHPEIDVDPDAIFVADGDVHTSAGISAGIDLCLGLVEADYGPALARQVAQQLVVYLQRPGGQAQFSARMATAPTADPVLRKVMDAVVDRPGDDHSLEAMGVRAGYSSRHLARVFQREVGISPGRFVERVRVEAAKERLQRGDEPLAAVARASGLGSAETLRRAFARELSTTPAAWRQRFRSASGEPVTSDALQAQ